MNIEKQKAFLIRFTYFALILGLAFMGVKYLLPVLFPFVIGVAIAMILRPFIDWIQEKFPIKRSLISIVILILFYGLVVLATNIFGVELFSFLQELFSKLPKLYVNTIEPAVQTILASLLSRFPEIEVYFEEGLNAVSESVFSYITTASSVALGAFTGIAAQLPSILVKLIFTIVSSFFFTIDYHEISDFLLRQFPEGKRKMLVNIKQNVIGTLIKFIRAYATLMFITFVELSIGFNLLGISNAFVLAFLVSIVDILPILGTGTILIPWAAIAFVFGKNTFGIGMLVLYLVILVVRQSLEPKIVGQQIGLHPVVTLICIFVGAQLLGVVGVLLLPVTVTILKKMNDEGTIRLFK
ncbi:MAG: sporulation integral membrane protein YtvI [Clostridiales bacterium]|nr:sporulation integral membrane protein YtvI [Clostridiales bacterium]